MVKEACSQKFFYLFEKRLKRQSYLIKDLTKQLVFLVRSHQDGKIYLSKDIPTFSTYRTYLNYGPIKDRHIIHNQSCLEKTDLLILDELHKMPEWKNYLKNLFDTKPERMHILVAGNTHLDVYDHMENSLTDR